MSAEDLEVVRSVLAAINRHDLAAADRLVHSDVEMIQAPTLADTGTYQGRAAVAAGLRRFLEEWEHLEFEPRELIDAGGRVFIAIRLRGRGRRSGVDTKADVFHVWTVRDGKVLRFEVYSDEESAREMAGLK